MKKEDKVKEMMINIYGGTVLVSALIMMITAVALIVMSIIYITDSQLLRSATSILIAGVLIYYSIAMKNQIKIDRQEEMNGSPVYKDRFGQPQEHPAAKVVRSSRTQMMSALKQLNLEIAEI